jgi:hypothetical protein
MCIDVMHVTDVCQVGDMASYRCVVCCGATGDPITFCHMSSSRASSVDMIGEKFKPREPFFLLSLFSLVGDCRRQHFTVVIGRTSATILPHRRYLLLTE